MASEGGGTGGPSEPAATNVKTTLLSVASIQIPLAVHFLLVGFVFIVGWLPPAYLFSHIFFFIVGLWCGHDRVSILPVIAVSIPCPLVSPIFFSAGVCPLTLQFIVVLAITVLLDIIQLGIYFGPLNQPGSNSTWQFSAAMCIINLLGKPVTVALACVAIYSRLGGNVLNLFGNRRDSYTVIQGSSQAQ